MKKITKILSSILGVAFVLSTGYSATKLVNIEKPVEFEKRNAPFFEDEFESFNPTEDASLDIFYDKFPKSNNTTNFMSLGQASYANINGREVKVDAFYRLNSEALNNPNVGVGIMLYQCIKYKITHPEEDVKAILSTYRLSVTAAVCVDEDSKFYGYMRSVFDADYDEFGFVRIAYMIVEAAKMGIEVRVVGHLNAYGLKQYSATASNNIKKRDDLDFPSYFSKASKLECYEKYAKGQKVSKYLKYTKIKWTVVDKGSIDMMHNKICAVSNYIDKDGIENGPAVWFGSTNLDGIDYRGANGNNGTQSGVIVSNHNEIFDITYNYVKLVQAYPNQEDIYYLRDLITKKNIEQINLINEGKEDQIPANEKIVYLGSESDEIFKLFFTPFGGNVGEWNTVYNPYCDYIDRFYKSKDSVEFVWNCATFVHEFYIAYHLMEKVSIKMGDGHLDNKMYVHLDGLNTTVFDNLVPGENCGSISVNEKMSKAVHSKDIQMSYVDEDGLRHYLSLMSTCNFHMGALSYQTNSILIIDETDETGNNFYKIFGDASSGGVITL